MREVNDLIKQLRQQRRRFNRLVASEEKQDVLLNLKHITRKLQIALREAYYADYEGFVGEPSEEAGRKLTCFVDTYSDSYNKH